MTRQQVRGLTTILTLDSRGNWLPNPEFSRSSILVFVLSLMFASPAMADLRDARFGSANVYDVQRSPAFPVAGASFTVSSFARPYGNGYDQLGQYDIGATQYIAFVDVDPSPDNCSYAIYLYEADGTVIKRISSGGEIYAIGEEGFLHVSTPGPKPGGGVTRFGTFIVYGAGYQYGDHLTYVPDEGLATCLEVEEHVSPFAVTPPGPPGDVTATAGNAEATVSFEAPLDDGGLTITGYLVTSAPGGVTASCASSPCTVTGLNNGTRYEFTVVAVNSKGDSRPSAPSNQVVPSTVPGAPTGLAAEAGSGEVILHFTPGPDNGAPITNYEYSLDGGAFVALVPDDVTSPVTIGGLTGLETYSIRLRAVNARGPGAASAVMEITPLAPPSAPVPTLPLFPLAAMAVQLLWTGARRASMPARRAIRPR